MATLRSEPSNDYDPNAIQVLIEDKVVGYLDRETAKKINGQLKKLGYDFIEAACKAIVVYRFVPSIGREAFGVKLDIFTKGQHKASQQQKPSAFSFVVKNKECTDPRLLYIGNRINFYAANPSTIVMYLRGGMEGENIGLVPPDMLVYLSQHLSENLQYVASIVSITGDQVEVHCELISAEETAREIEAYRTERVNRLSKELSSPYHPRKNMRFSLKAERALIEKGDFLQLRSVPSKEEFLNDSANCRSYFESNAAKLTLNTKQRVHF